MIVYSINIIIFTVGVQLQTSVYLGRYHTVVLYTRMYVDVPYSNHADGIFPCRPQKLHVNHYDSAERKARHEGIQWETCSCSSASHEYGGTALDRLIWLVWLRLASSEKRTNHPSLG